MRKMVIEVGKIKYGGEDCASDRTLGHDECDDYV